MPRTFTPALAAVLSAWIAPIVVDAQPASVPAIMVAEDLRISGANRRFVDVRISPNGFFSVYDGGSGPLRVFSPEGRELSIPSSVLPPDLRTLHWGWVGDSVWLYQTRPPTLFIVELTPSPRLVVSRRVPAETPGPPGTTPQARREPVAFPDIRAVYPDGGLLIRQSFPTIQARIALGRPELSDENTPNSFLVRTNADHRYVSFVRPGIPTGSNPCVRSVAVAGQSDPARVRLPYCVTSGGDMSPDARRMASLSAALPVTDPAVLRVTTVITGGDTIFSREYHVPALRITSREADSIRVAELNRVRRYPELVTFTDSIFRTAMPQYRLAVSRTFVGYDGSVLLWLNQSTQSPWYLLIDPRGEPVGTFVLRPEVTVTAVSRDAIWGVERRPDTPGNQFWSDLVRYKIVR